MFYIVVIMKIILKLLKKKMVNSIVETWDDRKLITNELVYNIFRCAVIGNSLNGDEDSKFTTQSEMKIEKLIMIDDIEKEGSYNIK